MDAEGPEDFEINYLSNLGHLRSTQDDEEWEFIENWKTSYIPMQSELRTSKM